jgi:hypothetical protein
MDLLTSFASGQDFAVIRLISGQRMLLWNWRQRTHKRLLPRIFNWK